MLVLTRMIAICALLLTLAGCNEPGFPAHLKAEKISANGLQAMLVTPRTDEPLDVVMVLGGSDGGYGSLATAKKLAEAGFAALTVAYFGEAGLPQNLNSIPLEYFDSALSYIDANPDLHRNNCGQVPVLGASRGAELALLLASRNSAYGPVVAIAPSSHVWGAIGDSSSPAWTLAGKPIAFVPRHSAPDYEVERFVGRDYFAEDLRHADAVDARISVEDIAAQILLISGTDDQLWPSSEMAGTVVARLQAHGKPNLVQHLKYEGAGHVIGPGAPAAATEVSLSGGPTVVLGGSETANRLAQEHSWPVIKQLLREPVCRVEPAQAGFSSSGLSELRNFLKTSGTSSLVLMHKGKVLFEYGDIHEKHTVHSIRKALLNSLYGVYVDRGVIDLDATIADLGIDDIHGLAASEQQATVRQLLQSRSGVYHPAAATSEGMLKSIPERGSNPPGSAYVYNNWDFNTAGAIFEKLTGESIYTAFDREIAKPIGMRDYHGDYVDFSGDDLLQLTADGFYQHEPDKSRYPAYHFRMSAYDLALYGQLFANGGRWGDQQLLSEDWIEASTTSYSVTNAYMDFGYGMLWNVINPNEQRTTKSFYHTGLGIHMLAVYPGSEFVLVHRVQTEQDYEFEQDDLYKVIGLVFGAREN